MSTITDREDSPLTPENSDAGLIEIADVAEPGAAPLPAVHPGEILRDDYLLPLKMTVYSLAKALGVSQSRMQEIVQGNRALSADTALRLARLFSTSPQFWLNLQAAYDLDIAREKMGAGALDGIQPLETGAAE